MTSYYDIDSILADDELLPCTTLFDFSHLGHLDDASPLQYLKEETKLKMPLWAMEKWASLGYIKVSLPRHLNQKAREKMEADPLAFDLRYVCII
jgi:GINS complex subunit 3